MNYCTPTPPQELRADLTKAEERELLDRLDTDGDGRLDYHEFLEFCNGGSGKNGRGRGQGRGRGRGRGSDDDGYSDDDDRRSSDDDSDRRGGRGSKSARRRKGAKKVDSKYIEEVKRKLRRVFQKSVDRGEASSFKRIFEKIDRAGSGTVSRKELSKALNKVRTHGGE